MTKRILFVCLGNICRSPTAEGVFRNVASDMDVEIDSAGTGAWHIGEPADGRATQEAAKRGYDLTPLRARQVNRADFEYFDLILAMDLSNLRNLERMRPAGSRATLKLFLEYAPQIAEIEVPDPYYNNQFERVLDMIEAASKGLRAELL